jgi:penicillin-binding protein 1A
MTPRKIDEGAGSGSIRRLGARARKALVPLGRVFTRPAAWIPLVGVCALGIGAAWGSWQNLCATCPSIAQIRTWEPEQTTKLFAHDGELLAEIGYRRRTPVSIDSLPAYVAQAVIAIEDKRFYRHGGFDPRGFTRAVLGVVTGRSGRLGGGSTITQQLARNMFTDEIGFERRIFGGGVTRKLKEIQVALWLEESYAKDQILEAYLNQINMGPVWGFQGASQAFFGKNLAEVNVAEAALLAAVLNRPSTYNPFRQPENALRRRNLVLDRMAEQAYLTREEAEQWKAAPLPSDDHSSQSLYGIAPHFEEWVRQILDDRYGEDVVYRGGLRVFTTLDLAVQEAAVEAMDWGWHQIEEQPGYRHPKYEQFDSVETFPGETPYMQGALIALDPHSGHVRAMIGGRDFVQSKFDRVRLAERQAGSAFKPFVYAAALESGVPVSHVIVDEPYQYTEVTGEIWEPKNFEGEFEGPMTLREALRRSINIPAIKLGWDEVGMETVTQTARRLGIRTRVENVPSTAIGAAAVKPIELAEAYSAFASLGSRVTPFPILRVENARGELIWEPQRQSTVVLDSAVARIMVDLLEDAANRGTGPSHRVVGGLPYEVPTAGKTGTTNEATDVWFSAFTPNLLAVVWFGMDRPQPIFRIATATGGGLAAPVWGRFMKQVYYGDVIPESETGGVLPIPERWPFPTSVTTREIDRRTGKLWASWCEDPEANRYSELFVAGTEPREYCGEDPRADPLRRRPPPG